MALGSDYQCHSCGREFSAAVVRVEGTPVVPLPYPEAAVVAADEPDLAGILPERPIILGGDADLHARVATALGGPANYIFVADEEALALPPSGASAAGVGFASPLAAPDNAAAIARFLASVGL